MKEIRCTPFITNTGDFFYQCKLYENSIPSDSYIFIATLEELWDYMVEVECHILTFKGVD